MGTRSGIDRSRTARRTAVASLLALAAAAGPAQAAGPITFVPTGAEQTVTVPAGVTSARIVAIGGKGGAGGSSGGAGGFGALASADLPVAPGQVLYVEVGANGSDGAATPAFNGGGPGGAGSYVGGAGGGASDVRTATRGAGTSLGQRLVTAGGGGGGGSASIGGAGGAAGAAGGAAASGGQQGQPGTATGPGLSGGSCPAGNGSLGAGGAGAATCGVTSSGGGGGGGGLYGGSGGGASSAGAGGGGGSSGFAAPATNATLATDTTGQPSISVTFGAPAASTAPVVSAPVTSVPPPTSQPVVPLKPADLTGLSVASRSFRVATGARPGGTSFTFTLSRAATVRIDVQSIERGRLSGGVCRPATRARRRRPACERLMPLATIQRALPAGLNSVRFSGLIAGRALRPGPYRAAATATTPEGRSASRSVRFAIVRR